MCTAPQEQDFISKMAPKSIENWGLHLMVKFSDMNSEYIFSLKVRYSLKGKNKTALKDLRTNSSLSEGTESPAWEKSSLYTEDVALAFDFPE